MYHRFEENKYPSTNIRIKDFKTHLELIEQEKFIFVNPNNFEQVIKNNKKDRKILLTIDDGFLSFYEKAWPILKKKKIPFILFVSTREVGKFGYMSWEQINEIAKEDFVEIGNHSHSHEYLIDENVEVISDDIKKSIKLFEKNLGYNSKFFSYPLGEYSLKFKEIIENLNFKYAFGQHSGVADETKDFFELPRFPINEKYGDLKRFNFLINLLPLQYKALLPDDKFLFDRNNPPSMIIEFFNKQKNIKLINCFSNEGGDWKDTKLTYSDNKIEVKFTEKFLPRRGRINCSMNDKDGWRWLGTQFTLN